MDYKHSTEPPPIYDKAKERFPNIDFNKGTTFTYGDTIHCVDSEIPDDLLEHELVHIRQQQSYEGGHTAWWDRYLTDTEFRRDQEMEAYRIQYRYILKKFPDKQRRWSYLNFYADCLVRMYDVNLGRMQAQELIKKEK